MQIKCGWIGVAVLQLQLLCCGHHSSWSSSSSTRYMGTSENVENMTIERAHRIPSIRRNPQDSQWPGLAMSWWDFCGFLTEKRCVSEPRTWGHFSGKVFKWISSRTSRKMFRTRETNSGRSDVNAWNVDCNTQCSTRQCFGWQLVKRGAALRTQRQRGGVVTTITRLRKLNRPELNTNRTVLFHTLLCFEICNLRHYVSTRLTAWGCTHTNMVWFVWTSLIQLQSSCFLLKYWICYFVL